MRVCKVLDLWALTRTAAIYSANSAFIPNEYIVVFRPEIDPVLGVCDIQLLLIVRYPKTMITFLLCGSVQLRPV